MTVITKIEWADSTFNPWEGCQKTGSPGCDHCYAETRNARFGGGVAVNWGPHAPRRRTSVANWRQPIAWNAGADTFEREHGRRRRVFCASLADVFDNAVPGQWRADLMTLILATPRLDWLLLTKRIGNASRMLDEIAHGADPDTTMLDWLPNMPNLWIGATVVNQQEADRDIPKLLALDASVRFLSMEPLLGPVDLRFHIFSEPTGNWRTRGDKRQMELRKPADGGLHWVIVGGESGPGARPMHPDWARGLRDQCAAFGVPFLFKQWGEWICAGELRRLPGGGMPGFGIYDACLHDMATDTVRVGKKAAGRLLDGVEHNGFPEVRHA